MGTNFEDFPLSKGQLYLWLEHQINPRDGLFNFSQTWKLSSEIDINSLKLSIEEVTRIHPALRTTYKVTDGEVFQRVNSTLKSDVTVLFLPMLNELEVMKYFEVTISNRLILKVKVDLDG